MKLFESLHRPFEEAARNPIRNLGVFYGSELWRRYANAFHGILKELEPNFELNQQNNLVLQLFVMYFLGCKDFENHMKTYMDIILDSKQKTGAKKSNHPPGSLSKGICLVGGVGSGKSLFFKAAYIFVQRWLNVNGFKPFETEQIMIDARHHDKETREYAVSQFGYRTQNHVHRPFTCYIDDIFKESGKVNDYGTQKDIIVSILNLRYNVFSTCGKITHASSNFSPKQMLKLGFIDERLSDRMIQMYNFIILDAPGVSYRKKGIASANIIRPTSAPENNNSCEEISRNILTKAPDKVKCPETGKMVDSIFKKLKSIPENRGAKRVRTSYEKNYFGKEEK